MNKKQLDAIFESLEDGKWHDINELSTQEGLRNISMNRLMLTLKDLFAEYNFVELGESWKGDPKRPVVEARLTPSVQAFVRKIKWIERAEREHRIFNHQLFFLGWKNA